jgi:hypothetical protein
MEFWYTVRIRIQLANGGMHYCIETEHLENRVHRNALC